MNARHPLSYITADPVVGATRFDDDREAEDAAYEAMLVEAEDCAPAILQAQLDGLKPGDWFKSGICLGAMWSPDDMASWGIEKNDELKDAVAELMTCTAPEAAKVRQLMAKLFGKDYAMDIYLARTQERH